MTLPSDSSYKYFPNNTISHYITQLPSTINLQGQWEVALCEFVYPHTWHNVNKSNNLFGFDLGDGKLISRRIPPGCYETIPDILKVMNISSLRDKIHFQFNTSTKRVKIKTENKAKLILEKGLSEILGFDPQTVEGACESPYFADPHAAFPYLYVYTDLVTPQIVGDVQAPLLRIVTVNGSDGEVISAYYDRPHYVPVARNCFQTVEMAIRLNSGDFVPFERGKVIAILHFRLQQII